MTIDGKTTLHSRLGKALLYYFLADINSDIDPANSQFRERSLLVQTLIP
ncbi:MAG: hypothetical protein ACTSRG_03690 [Candidatus Helarchaeota archaeon]